jgi:hypothetical protein
MGIKPGFRIKYLSLDLWVGLGAYYYHLQKEKGCFNCPNLTDPPFAKNAVNAYRNDFSINVIDLLPSGGISYRWDRMRFSASVGAIPVYFLLGNPENEFDSAYKVGL